MKFEHFLLAFELLTVCPVGIPTNTPLTPFLTASCAEPSVYTCVQSVCVYFSSSISRVRAICCVGICCSAGSRTGTLRKMVPLRSFWFQSLLQRRCPLLICRSRISSCVLLRPLVKCLSSVFSTYFWLEYPAFCGADDQVVSGSSLSG